MSELVNKSSFSSFIVPSHERDLLAELLADKRSVNTRRAYAWDLRDFFMAIASKAPSPELLAEFLTLPRTAALSIVLKYKADMIERKLKEATVNRRLSAVRSLVDYARKVGKCDWDLHDISGEKVVTYRDTSGVETKQWKKVLAMPDRSTLKGKRDYIILRLLWDNVLRRSEITNLDIGDWNRTDKTLMILAKGKGSQKTRITVSNACAEAINSWLKEREPYINNEPMFISLDNANYGRRLLSSSIHYLVSSLCKQAGIEKSMSPHRVRHSGITAALDATGGNVRKVQKLSRHAKLDTLMIYDDNRANIQGEMTNLLEKLID
jgi:integrase/recombinase XerC